ncbi:MAG: hypothetical protein R8G33_02570 [Gammaproteobacteria bacterium]|nr:hypothetical protein [Gammaproteobacteria bacterium]
MKIISCLAFLLFLYSSCVSAEIDILQPTQNPEAVYRLFNTKNTYTLLELNTRTGQIWQVQWGSTSERFTTPLNEEPIVLDGKPGRFTLHPTANIYTFILIDQVNGKTWHVQWGGKEDRFRYLIE